MGADVLRAGIVGCDTSHVVAFTKLINDPAATGSLAKVEVVCAFPGGSPDIPSSRDRVAGFTADLRAAGVEIVDTVADVLDRSDVILLESVDGRVHLEQFRQLAAGKPVFIDKPAAASLADLIAIFQIAEETDTPCFSSSALRFSEQVVGLKKNAALGEITGCTVASPFQTEPHHPDLFWYGVHGIESVYTLMGAGCESVRRTDVGAATIVVGTWPEGRFATYHGLKGHADYAFTAFGTTGLATQNGFSGYAPLVNEICQFFLTGKPPVSAEETIEMFAFMEAADESLRNEGRPISIREVLDRANKAASAVVLPRK
jgi:predicted dehydrogenase